MIHLRALLPAVALIAAAPLIAPPAAPTTYYFGVSPARTNIAFESRAEVETIIGSTNTLEGTAKLDEKEGTVACELKVPVSSLRTGIDLRDEHLRSDLWLDAAKFPNITFRSTKGTKKKGEQNIYVVEGDLTIKGKTKAITIEVKVIKIPDEIVKKTRMEEGTWLKFYTSFPVKIADFGVAIPDGVGPKVEETWHVKFDAFGTTVKPEK